MADGDRAPIRADLDAEAAVLSAALLDDGAALDAVDSLEPSDFWADANRIVFETIRDVVRTGARADVVTVSSAIRASGKLERIGGTPYLAQLADATPAVSHVRDHANVVRNLARLRRAQNLFRKLSIEAGTVEVGDVDEWLSQAEASAYQATAERRGIEETAMMYGELALDTYRAVEQASERRKAGEEVGYGVTTGLKCLDRHLGGYFGGQLIVIAARPRCGKTSLAAQAAEAIAAGSQAVVFLSCEMTRQELMERAIARRIGVPVRYLRQGLPGDWNVLARTTEELSRLPLIVDDESDITPLRARAKVRRHYAKIRSRFPGIDLGAVVVDYLQLLNPDASEARRSETRAIELGRITRSLKLLAKELNVPVIALSQLRRPEKHQKVQPPTLEDLRDSGRIEEDADVVILLHREDLYRPPHEERTNDADIMVAKARGNEEAVHTVKWDGQRTQFYEPEKQPDLVETFEGGW